MVIKVKKTRAELAVDDRPMKEKHPHENGLRDDYGVGFSVVMGLWYAHCHVTGKYAYASQVADAVNILTIANNLDN